MIAVIEATARQELTPVPQGGDGRPTSYTMDGYGLLEAWNSVVLCLVK